MKQIYINHINILVFISVLFTYQIFLKHCSIGITSNIIVPRVESDISSMLFLVQTSQNQIIFSLEPTLSVLLIYSTQ